MDATPPTDGAGMAAGCERTTTTTTIRARPFLQGSAGPANRPDGWMGGWARASSERVRLDCDQRQFPCNHNEDMARASPSPVR